MSSSYGVTEYPNTFKRQGSFPLDKTDVFDSLPEAIDYAESSLIAYEGQIISVKENDDIRVYVLKKNDDNTKKFKLASIQTSSSDVNDAIIDMNNLINSKVGIWSITRNINTNEAFLDFDILYGVDADSYVVFFNDNPVSDNILLTDKFVTNLDHFKNDSVVITLKFYNDGLEAFELKANAIYKNETVIFGSLYLTKLL